MSRVTVGVGCLALVFSVSVAYADTGVEGLVIDADTNVPVSQAIVFAEPLHHPVSALIPEALTDSDGKFQLKLHTAGGHAVYASKERDYYPDAVYDALRAAVGARVVMLKDGEITRDVVVRIQRGGRLTLSVVDAHSGEPVGGARVQLIRSDDPFITFAMTLNTTGRRTLVIPQKREFLLEVVAAGYRDWKSVQETSSPMKGTIKVQAREAAAVTVHLHRLQ